MYQVRLLHSDNSDLYFNIYKDNCEHSGIWGEDRTVTSWFGEPYKLEVKGNAAHLGNYYTIEVIDLGLMPDDYSNISDTADPIVPDGSHIDGVIDYNSSFGSDNDWFVFTPAPNTLYEVTLTGELNKGYKSMRIFQIDEFGGLHETLSHNAWTTDVSVRTFFIETDDDVYVQMYNAEGAYTYSIRSLGHFPPDGNSNDCASATLIPVDAPPLPGTLTHNPDGSLEEDWLTFNTQPLHMYQVRLLHSNNSDLYFNLFKDNCEGTGVWGEDRTVTSWFGEPYKLQVKGNAAHLGNYYTVEVIDLGLMPDDYPNIHENAGMIPKDGTPIEGEIEYISSYHSDEDWFTFVAGQDGVYDFQLEAEINKGYKNIKVYSKDELGVLHLEKDFNVWAGNIGSFSASLLAGDIYVKLSSEAGTYVFSVVSPEPRCGDLDHPYPPGDVTKDCYVNLEDLAAMCANWMTCTSPNPPCTE